MTSILKSKRDKALFLNNLMKGKAAINDALPELISFWTRRNGTWVNEETKETLTNSQYQQIKMTAKKTFFFETELS
jgi:hypothetical protein